MNHVHRTTRAIRTGLGIAAGIGLLAVTVGLTAAPAGATVPLSLAKGGQAGYYVSPGSNVTSVKASFVAPTVTCASNVGVQELRFGIVAPQINATVTEFAQLDAVCDNGVLSYGAVLGANGNAVGGAITPGDALSAALVITPTLTKATLVDHTSAQTFHVSGGGQTLDETAFIGERPSTGQSAIPTFSSPVPFSALSVNGNRIKVFTTLRYNQVSGADVLITTSPLSHGTFTLTFVRNF